MSTQTIYGGAYGAKVLVRDTDGLHDIDVVAEDTQTIDNVVSVRMYTNPALVVSQADIDAYEARFKQASPDNSTGPDQGM